MPLHETVGPLARSEWLLVTVPFQLENGGLVRGYLVVLFRQLTSACPVFRALVDIQRGAVLLGKGLKISPLVHFGGNIVQQHPTPKRKLIVPYSPMCQ